MKRTLAVLGASILCFVGLGVHALAQTPESERTLITDPDMLESMGFPRDATNVYWAKSENMPGDRGAFRFWPVCSLHAGRPEVLHREGRTRRRFPGSTRRRRRVLPEPEPHRGPEDFADAQVNLPTGANIQAGPVVGQRHERRSDMAVFLFEVCHPGFSAGAPPSSRLEGPRDPRRRARAGTSRTSSAGSGGATPSTTGTARYIAAGALRRDTGLTLQKIRYQWARQVSPAPAVATFLDVPTGHAQFQYIEALVAAGITAGCGGGNYCPGNNLTRGQMAVFLSLALGLYFP